MEPHGRLCLNLALERSRAGRAAIVAGLAAAFAAIALSPVKLCLVARLFHVPCPGCGLTRAALAIARGDVIRALALHPLSVVVVPVVGFVATAHAYRYVRTGSAWSRAPGSRSSEAALAALALLLVAVWIARFFGWFGGPVAV